MAHQSAAPPVSHPLPSGRDRQSLRTRAITDQREVFHARHGQSKRHETAAALRVFGVVAFSWLCATPAAAANPDRGRNSTPGQTEPVVVAPVPLETIIQYPPNAQGSARVVLDFTVTKEGRTENPVVVSGAEPFRSAALEAVVHFHFQPAKREGRPVAARVRYTLEFQPPVVEAPVSKRPDEQARGPRVPPSGPTPKAKESAPTEAPIEVLVRGERPPAGSVELTREEARALPGAFGDPLRTIEAQPGVVPIVSGLPFFFVRGAPPANVGFFIDGVDVPLLYHAFFGPSVLQPASIQSVELFAGGGPARYGRFAGPVVVAHSAPLSHEWHGEASVRAIDAGAIVEAPFGSDASARVGGRYSYAGLVLSQISDARLEYWDYQAQLNYNVSAHDTVGVLAFGAYDFFDAGEVTNRGSGAVLFHRIDLRWDNAPDADTRVRLAATGGYDESSGQQSRLKDRSLRLRTEIEKRLDETTTLYFGADARGDRFDLTAAPDRLTFTDFSTLFPSRAEGMASAYVGANMRVAPRIIVEPGLRADLYTSFGTAAVGVDPRILATFELSPNLVIAHSLVLAHQIPNFVPQVPGARAADLEGGLQQALMYSSEVRFRLPFDLTASAAVFRHGYFNALDPIGGTRDFNADRSILEQRSIVSAVGLELKLSRPLTKRLGGLISYTLSRSEFSTGSRESISGFDRPHVLQGAVSYAFGSGFRAGMRALYYSGIPALDLRGQRRFTSARRGPPYVRLDSRVEKRFPLGDSGRLAVVFEVLNLTATDEVLRVDCGNLCKETVAGPIVLPSLGVEASL